MRLFTIAQDGKYILSFGDNILAKNLWYNDLSECSIKPDVNYCLNWEFNNTPVNGQIELSNNTGILSSNSGYFCNNPDLINPNCYSPDFDISFDISLLDFGVLYNYSTSSLPGYLYGIYGNIAIGISPPRPDYLKINGQDAYVVEGENVDLSTEIPSPTSSYSVEFAYSIDNNITWNNIATEPNQLTVRFTIPSCTKISFSSRVKKKGPSVTCVSYSPYFYRKDVEVRKLPELDVHRSAGPCTNSQGSINIIIQGLSNEDGVRVFINEETDSILYYNSSMISKTVNQGNCIVTLYYCKKKDTGKFSNFASKNYGPYTILPGPGTAPKITSQPSPQTICEGSNASMTISASGTTLNYNWQYSVNDSSPWNDISNDAVYSNAASKTLNIIEVTTSMNGYHYRCIVSGECTPFETSSSVILTVTPKVGDPTTINISAGTEPSCQLNNGTTMTTYATTASNSTDFSWSVSPAEAGAIGSASGIMTWANGYCGTATVSVKANGCNGASAEVIRTVLVTPTVVTPTNINVMEGTEPICQLTNGTTTTTYTSTASNSTGYFWSVSPAGAGAIGSPSGIMTWANGYSGVATISVKAYGCNGPSAEAIRTVSVNQTVNTPIFTLGISSSRCQGAGSLTYTATTSNSTGITYSLDAASIAGGNSINPSTGEVTYSASWHGTSTITATAVGCNGPKTAIHIVTITPTVGIPTFTLGTNSNRCQGADWVAYTAAATNSTTFTYSLDAASITVGNSINPSTGVVTYSTNWYGTSTITASAAGCNGPKTATHTATITRTVGVPTAITVSAGTEPSCQLTNGTTMTTYATTASNSTDFSWSVSPAEAGAIGSASGIMTWTNGYYGTVTVSVKANGCNGPSAAVIRTVIVTPTVGTPTTIIVSVGTEPSCQLTNGTTTTTYTSTASNSTGYSWSVSPAGAGVIGSTSGIMTWANGYSGAATISVKANGCNGPSAEAIRTVCVNQTVNTPIFTLGISSSRCQGAGSLIYTATASNSTGITYSLDAASLAGGNSINPSTGEVTYSSSWYGTSTITASAAGCNGPKTAIHTITTTVSLPVSVSITAFPSGAICAGTSITFSATPVNGGTSPTFQWKMNGTNVGNNSNTYNYTPTNGQIVTCEMTSNSASCLTGSLATSNSITMIVNPLPTSASGPNVTICGPGLAMLQASSLTSNSTIRWYNQESTGNLLGTSITFTTPTIENTTSYWAASYIENTGCEAATRTRIQAFVNTPQAITLESGNTTICENNSASFIITASNATSYHWKVSTDNGTNWTEIASSGSSPVYSGWNTNALNISATKVAHNGYQYQCRVAGNTSCMDITSSSKILFINKPVISYNITDVKCHGGNDGAITIMNTTGGTSPYEYNWSSSKSFSATTKDISGLKACDYTVKVTDIIGCYIEPTIYVTEPPLLNLNILPVTHVACYGENSGSITLSASGGKGSLNYSMDGTSWQASNTFTRLYANTYAFYVQDDNFCQKSITQLVSQPSALSISVLSVIHIACYETNSGSVTLSASGGTGSIYYSKDEINWQTSNSFNGLSAGNYTFYVKDFNNCTKQIDNIQVNEPPKIIFETIIVPVKCKGEGNGTLTINISGGIKPYSINLSSDNYDSTFNNANSSVTFNGLSPGDYFLTITDLNGCVKTSNITIHEPDISLSASITNITNPSCFGYIDGSIKVTTLGGWGDYSYFPIGNGDGSYNNLGKGDYSIKILDKQGCQVDLFQTLIHPSKLEVSKIVVENLSCNGDGSGKIQLSIKGGTKGYLFNFGNGFITDSSATGLNANIYTYRVIDSKNCEISDKITLNEPDPLTANIIKSNYNGYNISCNGGIDSVTVIPNGGTHPYKFIFNGNEYKCPLTGYKLKNLTAGEYLVRIEDSNNCSYDQTFNLTHPAKLLFNRFDIQNTSCFGTSDGKIDITIHGGVSPYQFIVNDKSDNIITQYNGNTFTYSNLVAGNYELTVEDQNGCSINALFTINQPELLKASFTSWDVSCYGSEDGRAEVTLSGGNAPYSYQWIGENDIVRSTTFALTNAKAYAWKAKITDSKGCSGVSGLKGFIESTINIYNPPKPLTLETAITNVQCNGGSDGTIKIIPNGGWGKYNYSTNGIKYSTNNLLTRLSSGFYNVWVSDSLGCVKKDTVIVSELTPLKFTTSTIDATCHDSKNGLIEVHPTGGTTPNFTFYINSKEFNGQLDTLAAGTYEVIVKDANGCIALNNATINQPNAISYSSELTSPSCGNANGVIAISPAGGIGAHQVQWLMSSEIIAVGIKRTGLASGNYSFRITDGNSCSKEFLQPLSDLGGPEFNIISQNPLCYSGNNGSIEISVTAGILPCNISFSKNGGLPVEFGINSLPLSTIYNNLSDGFYNIQVTDDNGCKTIKTNSLNSPEPISVKFTSTSITCLGGSNGSATVTVIGGVGPFITNWFDSFNNQIETGNSIDHLKAGHYSITTLDANGCSMGDLSPGVDILEPANPLRLTTSSIDNVTCHGDNNGNVKLLATGGWGNYKFSMDGNAGVVNNFFDNLAAGAYSFKVSDRYGCEDSISVNINQNNPIALTISKNDVKCYNGNDGTISLNASGGTGIFRYSINEGVTFYTSNYFNGLIVGDFKIVVKDENECLVTDAIRLTQPSELNIKITDFKDIKCNGNSTGEVVLSAIGGTPDYQFSKDAETYKSTTVFSNIYAGSHIFRAKDANGCISSTEKTLVQPSVLNLEVSSSTNVSCNGGSDGSVTLQAFGGVQAYKYSIDGSTWQNGAQFSDLSIGTFSLHLRDANNCPANTNVTISQPTQLMLSVLSTANVSCNGGNNGSVILSATGGTSSYQYKINDNEWQSNNEFVNLAANRYTFKTRDANGCTKSLSGSITQPNLLTLAISTATDVSCFGGTNGSIIVSAVGGTAPYKYINNGASPQASSLFNNLSEGNYSIVVQDSKGCTANISRSISQPQELSLALTLSSNVSCFGLGDGYVTLAASNGTSPYRYRISNSTIWQNSNTFGGLKNGDYTFEVIDNCGQVKSVNSTITQPTDLILSIENLANPLCYGNRGSLVLTAAGGITPYQFSKDGSSWVSTNTFNDLPADSYSFYIKDANGCQKGKSQLITQPNLLNLIISAYTDITCNSKNNGTVTLTGSGGTSPYQFNKDGIGWTSSCNFDNISPGNYTFTIKDLNGCTTSLNQYISEPNPLIISTINKIDPICFGYSNGILDILVNGGTTPYSYLWSNGSQVSSTGAIPSGAYTIVVTDSKGCLANATYTLVDPPSLKPNLPNQVTICSNQTFDIDAGIPNASYLWFSENGFTSNNRNTTITLPGIYYLIVSDSKGCLGKDSLILIKESNLIDANFLMPEKASVGDTIVIIEMSWPIPQSIQWIYPVSFIPIYQTDYSIYLVPQMIGKFSIGLNSFVGACSEYIDKVITVEPPQNKGKEQVSKLPIIKDVVAFPNPNRGDFSIVVDLNKEADALIEVYSVYGKQLLSRQFKGLMSYKVDINLFHTPGIYLVRVSTGSEFRSLRIIIE